MTVQAVTSKGQHILGSAITWTWTLTNGDTGAPVPVADGLQQWLASVVSGTLGVGGSVTWQGSLDGGATWVTLNDDTGSALTMTSTGTMKVVKERPTMVRPNCTAGDGTTSLLCSLVTRR
jgi:hypothetical protein